MWAMIAVSIAMAIWTCGLQIVQRRSTQKQVVANEGSLSENADEKVATDVQKV